MKITFSVEGSLEELKEFDKAIDKALLQLSDLVRQQQRSGSKKSRRRHCNNKWTKARQEVKHWNDTGDFERAYRAFKEYYENSGPKVPVRRLDDSDSRPFGGQPIDKNNWGDKFVK